MSAQKSVHAQKVKYKLHQLQVLKNTQIIHGNYQVEL